ncbi:MAG TPA: 2-oxoacid:ferredoxin oxidoreductase subunit beta [Clostridia bacterium]|nr:2-oxoacid:ferredoxin oxidoreductase subunit beta [Clostridia bacterium]
MFAEVKDYFRINKLPHLWCPGCGNGIATSCLVKSIKACNYNHDDIVVVSGIGCSSRITGYLNFDTLHTTHGRALPFATGIKMAKPNLKVFVVSGDGDASAIGGNHFIHSARRNIDMTLMIINNNIYGMTGGQYSPMTPTGSKATTSPYGNIDRNFDLAKLAVGAGATYVARATTYHTNLLTRLLTKASKHKGFAVVEVVSACPVSFGRKNKMGTPAAMLKWQKEHAVTVARAKTMDEQALKDKFVIGELHHSVAAEYTEAYRFLVESLREDR